MSRRADMMAALLMPCLGCAIPTAKPQVASSLQRSRSLRLIWNLHAALISSSPLATNVVWLISSDQSRLWPTAVIKLSNAKLKNIVFLGSNCTEICASSPIKQSWPTLNFIPELRNQILLRLEENRTRPSLFAAENGTKSATIFRSTVTSVCLAHRGSIRPSDSLPFSPLCFDQEAPLYFDDETDMISSP
ncbi:hypothetical protein MRB53_016344 [Persea americana]|uniref:Uncharacterized protein n=1 Tax=Persea americana TaxID=3435 RepID=A0ACC2M1Y7_PERAE|nr:hypothetical protein MRB53_016344 [Persea americana]